MSRLSQPGMQALSTSGSLSIFHTVSRGAANSTSPVIVIAISAFLRSAAPARPAHDLRLGAPAEKSEVVTLSARAPGWDWRVPPRPLDFRADHEHPPPLPPLCAAAFQHDD